MKKILAIFVLFLMMSLPDIALGENTNRIGFVDLEKAFYSSDSWNEAEKLISQKAEKIQGMIKAKKLELEKLEESIKKQLLILSEEARKEKEWEYQKVQRDYERFRKDSDDELKREYLVVRQKIINELAQVTERIGEKGSYTLIYEKANNVILYAGDVIDLTDEVIKAYNEQKIK